MSSPRPVLKRGRCYEELPAPQLHGKGRRAKAYMSQRQGRDKNKVTLPLQAAGSTAPVIRADTTSDQSDFKLQSSTLLQEMLCWIEATRAWREWHGIEQRQPENSSLSST